MHIHRRVRTAVEGVVMIGAAIVLTTAPAQSQSDIKPGDVTQLRLVCPPGASWCESGQYDKTGDKRWVERRNSSERRNKDVPGDTFDFVESDSNASSWIFLHDHGRNVVVGFNLDAMHFRVGEARYPPVTSGPISDVTFNECDLNGLRPLQGGIGLGEVAKKREDIDKDRAKELDDLKRDPIKLVRGLDRGLFVVDHHHGARAWIEANLPRGICRLVNPAFSTTAPAFWTELKERGWVRLADQSGNLITAEALPKTLKALPDDPYRTLAWMVRKADGYCRALMTPSPPPFAEFRWADWLRKRPNLPFVKVAAATDPGLWSLKKKDREKKQQEVLDAALSAVKGPEAKDLPGYRGDKAPSYECPPDPPGGVE